MFSAEDDAEDTIRPRLEAAGADLGRVSIVTAVRRADRRGRRSFSLQEDLSLLEAAIERLTEANLIIVDPVSSYLGN